MGTSPDFSSAVPLKFSFFHDTLFSYKEKFTIAVSFKNRFHLLIDKGMTNAKLTENHGFSANIITRLKRNHYISLGSIEKICTVMDCGADDISELVPDRTEEA